MVIFSHIPYIVQLRKTVPIKASLKTVGFCSAILAKNLSFTTGYSTHIMRHRLKRGIGVVGLLSEAQSRVYPLVNSADPSVNFCSLFRLLAFYVAFEAYVSDVGGLASADLGTAVS